VGGPGDSGRGRGPGASDEDAPTFHEPTGPGLRIFLIADVRGYTSYTRVHGDEAAARLAQRFTTGVSEVVADHGGAVISHAGDQVVAVFDSARRAIRAAIAAQVLLGRDSVDGEPIQAGIGLEAGEAEVVEGGHVSGALNVASRLCALAAPGQILASEVVTTLAGRVDNVVYKHRRKLRLRGIEAPVMATELYPEPVTEPAPAAGADARQSARWGARRWLVAAIGLVAIGAAAMLVAATRLAGSGAPTTSLPVPPGQWAVEIDPRSHSRVTMAHVGVAPDAIAARGREAWVADAVDGAVRSVREAREGGPRVHVGGTLGAIAFDGRRVWVADSAGDHVDRVDTETLHVGPRRLVGNGPGALALDRGTLWVASGIDGSVAHLDATAAMRPVDGQLRIPVGPQPTSLAVDGRYAWVLSTGSGTLTRVDRATGDRSPRTVGGSPTVVAAGAGSVWVADRSNGSVTRFTPDPIEPKEIIAGIGTDVTAMAYADGSLWIATAGAEPRLTQVDTTRERVVRRYDLGGAVTGVSAASGRVWATVVSPRSDHIGGTLKVATTGVPTVDPAFADHILSREILSMTNDGLVAFRHELGAAGASIVPDLAVAVPAFDNNEYVFHLRRGVRYWNGARLGPRDIKRAITRLFRLKRPAATLYGSIEGARECLSGAEVPCRLRDGIHVDERVGTIAFQLTKPDSDFLAALALPYAAAVPAGTATHRATKPLPGTGPYRIVSFAAGKMILRRNPYFRQWSSAAQPAGVPDEIDLDTGLNAAAARAADADVIHIDSLPMYGPEVDALGREAARTLHAGSAPQTWYVYFNVEDGSRFASGRAPLLRRAVNYAVSRRGIAATFGDRAAIPTCRILPPPLPGTRRTCPFAHDPGDPWRRPDAAQARRIARRVERSDPSALTAPITLRTPTAAAPVARALRRDLRTVGFQTVTIKRYSRAYPGALATSASYEIGIWRRYADIPSPYAFIAPVLGCPASATNLARFCGPRLWVRMHEYSPYRSAPGGDASAAWADIDARLEGEAVWAPLVNTRWIDSTSARVRHYEYNAQIGALLDQLWVR
jgi:peptide/nickel transport system substrate-binding protein